MNFKKYSDHKKEQNHGEKIASESRIKSDKYKGYKGTPYFEDEEFKSTMDKIKNRDSRIDEQETQSSNENEGKKSAIESESFNSPSEAVNVIVSEPWKFASGVSVTTPLLNVNEMFTDVPVNVKSIGLLTCSSPPEIFRESKLLYIS